MSGNPANPGDEDPGTPPDLPEEYADVYRDAYLRALAEQGATEVDQPAEKDRAQESYVSIPASRAPGRNWLVLAVLAVLLVLAAYLLGGLLGGDDDPDSSRPAGNVPVATASSSETSPQPRRTRQPVPSLGPAYQGPSAAVEITGAEASCTAPPGVDSSNDPVDYEVGNAVDDDTTTAWRCNGRARGETITLTLAEGTEVVELGLVPGYAKTDPSSGIDRYAENNRITAVRWTLADGVVIDQVLDPDPALRSVQSIRVPRTATGEIVLQIRGVERGARNTTAISAIAVAAADD